MSAPEPAKLPEAAEFPRSTEFLVEIGCEEIPADWLGGLVTGFADALTAELARSRLAASAVEGAGTPRRLVARADVALRQPDRAERITGPPARVGRDGNGWTRAALGFARRHGIGESELDSRLKVISTPRGEYLAIEQTTPGLPARAILPGVLEAALRALVFPKTMRWDAAISGAPFPFGRPVRWIVALHGGEVVPFRIEVAGREPVVAGDRSRGHRFRSRAGIPGAPFEVDSFEALRAGLGGRCVVLDPADRREALEAAVRDAAAEAGADPLPWPRHYADLVEWPGTVLGRYPDSFLALPEEIRHAVLVEHQKYIPLAAAPAFVAVTNMPDDAGGHIRRGAERVVRARLRDAAFFWEEDRKTPLADRREGLAGVLFHRRLGSFREKAERLSRLAARIAGPAGADPEAAAEAAGLAKCDLTSGLVGEFASLQGIAGGLLLREEGARETVWRAVYDHYRPGGLDGKLPRTAEAAAVSLADVADTLAGLTLAGESGSGAGDPFGLRRAAFSLIRTLADAPSALGGGEWLSPAELIEAALSGYRDFEAADRAEALARLLPFVEERLHSAFEREFPKGAIRAVLAGRGVRLRLPDARLRIEALAALGGSEDLAALSVAATRVRRILPPAVREGAPLDPGRFVEPAEKALHTELLGAEERVRVRFRRGEYASGLSELAALRPAVDRFFDEVLVMAEDPALRANRLALLARLDGLFAEVGDLRELDAAARSGREGDSREGDDRG